MPTIHFNGGPCDGTSRTITQDQLNVGAITCKGTTYVLSPPTLHSGFIVFFTAKTAQQIAAEHRAYSPASVSAAYSRLSRAIAHTAPGELRELRAQAARLRRIAR